jgi:hypothetical protein
MNIDTKSNNSNHKIIWVGILLLVVLTSAFVITQIASHKNSAEVVEDYTQIDSNNPLEVFYYTQKESPQNTQYKIWKVSPDLEKPDLNTHSFTITGSYPSVVTNSWKKNMILFVANSETESVIYSLDVSVQNSQPKTLFTVNLDRNKEEKVLSAKYLNNGDALAFITSYNAGGDSVLNIISLKNESSKENYQLIEKNPVSSSFDFLATTPDSKTIYLNEAGGEGDAFWSRWYKVDRDTRKVQQLEKIPSVAKNEENPTDPIFSPDRTKLAYRDFSTTTKQADLDFENYNEKYVAPCLNQRSSNVMQKYQSEGGTVMIQELKTGDTNEVFRNLSYSDNICKNVARRILSLKWLDNSHLAFETIEGVYALDIDTKQRQTLFTFERTISPGQQTRPLIGFIQLPFIFFSGRSSDHSIVQINTNKRFNLVSLEARKAQFFTFE